MSDYFDVNNAYVFSMAVKSKNCITVSTGYFPLKKTKIPFFQEFTRQITPIMRSKLNALSASAFELTKLFFLQGSVRRSFIGDEYFIRILDYTDYSKGEIHVDKNVPCNTHRGNLVIVNYEGYSYSMFRIENPKGGLDLGTRLLWVRWKSFLPDYEFISPEDELKFNKKSIIFEVCEELPQYVFDEFVKLEDSKGTTYSKDPNGWIDFINNPKQIPKKRVKLPTKITLPYEISDNPADYPDMQVSLYFDSSATDETAKKAEHVLGDGVNQYNAEREARGDDDRCIHYVSDPEINENAVSFHIDFGNAEPMKAIKYIVKYVQQGNIGVVRVMFE